MPLTADRNTHRREGEILVLGVAAAAKIFAGALVVANAAGYAAPGSTALGLKAVGRAEAQADNTGGANGAVTVEVRRGVFKFANQANDKVTAAHLLSDCYIVDDATVAATDASGTRSPAGIVVGVDSDGVWVAVGTFAVPVAAAVADIDAAAGAAAAGSAPTKAEFDAVVELANETKDVVNGLLASLRAAGLLAPTEE